MIISVIEEFRISFSFEQKGCDSLGECDYFECDYYE